MSMTLEDVRDECQTIQTIAQSLAPNPNWLSLGDLALRRLCRAVAWEYLGALAGNKSFPLVASGSYTFAAGDLFTGTLKALSAYWSGALPLTDGHPVDVVALRNEPLLQDGTFGTAERPKAVVDGLTIRLYPLITAGTDGILDCRYVKRQTAFAELSDSIQITDDAALALELTMGAFAVQDKGRVPPGTAMTQLLMMADAEIAALNRKVKRSGLIVPMPPLGG